MSNNPSPPPAVRTAVVDAIDRLLARYGYQKMMETGRNGLDRPHPSGIYGPKVLLINEYAGSGGDALALYFRRQRVGLIVGKRTWAD